jgi:F0F1-type ATP synthase assembly protein I
MRYLPEILGVLVGGMGGWLYWKFVGCQSGNCPIRSNLFICLIYGVTLGYFISGVVLKNKKKG